MIAAVAIVAAVWLAVCLAFIPLWAWALRDRRRAERAAEAREATRAARIAALARVHPSRPTWP